MTTPTDEKYTQFTVLANSFCLSTSDSGRFAEVRLATQQSTHANAYKIGSSREEECRVHEGLQPETEEGRNEIKGFHCR
jgi:hypothetical protein